MQENNAKVLTGTKPDFKLDYPEKISHELYLEMLETIFEVIRYEAY